MLLIIEQTVATTLQGLAPPGYFRCPKPSATKPRKPWGEKLGCGGIRNTGKTLERVHYNLFEVMLAKAAHSWLGTGSTVHYISLYEGRHSETAGVASMMEL